MFRAQEVWPGLPIGVSIDDAPGPVDTRTALLRVWADKAPNPDAAPVTPAADPEPPRADASMASAAETLGVTEQVAARRAQFTFNRLLPPVMAAAVEMVQEDLPSDPLSACLTFLVGLSGLLKIGTRASSSLRHHVPINLFFALVAWSGVAKSPPDESFFFTDCALVGTFNIGSILVCPGNTLQVFKLGVFAVAVCCS